MRPPARLAIALVLLTSLAACLVACLADYDVDGMTYPCRAPEDCVEGFECHPTRYICVLAGTSSTTAALDASLLDR